MPLFLTKAIFKKITFVVFLLNVLIIIYVCNQFFRPQHNIDYYYSIIKTQDLASQNIINKVDLTQIESCRRNYKCLKNFYKKLTLEKGVSFAFSHLSELSNINNGEYYTYCHHNAHAIGNAQFKISRGDLAGSFFWITDEKIFINIIGCAGGYYHGLLEAMAEGVGEQGDLVEKFTDLCTKFKNVDLLFSCAHGIGHAAFIQLGSNLDKALGTCDKIFVENLELNNCFFGVFMEYSHIEIASDYAKIKDSKGDLIVKYSLCNILSERYKFSCFRQSYYFLKSSLNKNGTEFKLLLACQQIGDKQYRKICIYKTASMYTLQLQSLNISNFCKKGTANSEEEILCISAIANRISLSLNNKFAESAKTNICKTLSFWKFSKCLLWAKVDLTNEIFFNRI